MMLWQNALRAVSAVTVVQLLPWLHIRAGADDKNTIIMLHFTLCNCAFELLICHFITKLWIAG